MDSKRYFTVDLLEDDAFLAWVNNPTPESDAYWKVWKGNDRIKTQSVRLARKILLSIDFKKTNPSEIERHDLFSRIKRTLQEDELASCSPSSNEPPLVQSNPTSSERMAPKRARRLVRGWDNMAAACIGLLVIALIIMTSKKSSTKSFTTGYAETSMVRLPDHSQVKLNGNSKLTFYSEWDEKSPREVWLEGEAYFSVKPSESGQKLVVYTSDELNVEVFGTEFNVSNRKGKTSVVLSSGAINLNIEKRHRTEKIIMKPGEMVEYRLGGGDLIKKEVDPQQYTSWTRDKLIFDNTSLREIKLLLETTYGLDVQITDENLLEKKLFGSAPSNNVGLLLQGLAKSLGQQIIYSGNKVMIKEHS